MKLNLLARCGIGDIVSHLARIDGMKEKTSCDTVKFWIGGYKNVPDLCKSIIENHGYECEIIKGWNGIHQNGMMFNYLFNKLGTNEKLLDLNFESDIFSNKIPSFYKYKMKFPFEYKGEAFEDDFFNEYTIGIQPNTTSGSVDFDHNGERMWPEERWIELIDFFVKNGHKIAIFGGENDNIKNLKESGSVKSYCGKLTVNQTIHAINRCSKFIGTNSWMWEVAAFKGIPTICLYFTNTFFASLHVPYEISDISKNLYIETDPKQSLSSLVLAFEKYENHEVDLKQGEYEFALLNNLSWYKKMNPSLEMLVVPKIILVEDLDEVFARKHNLNIHSFFKWINYPQYDTIKYVSENNKELNILKIKNLHKIERHTKKSYEDAYINNNNSTSPGF